MASTSTTPDLQQSEAAAASLVVSLPSLPGDAFEQMHKNLAEAFADENIVIATPDTIAPNGPLTGSMRLITLAPAAPAVEQWTLTASDYLRAHELAQQYQPRAVLLLGAEAQSLSAADLHALASSVLQAQCDLALPRYTLPPRSGLVNSAILYPISRALFGAAPRFPLAFDLALSPRMAERMAAIAARSAAASQPDALLWPVAEAAVAGYPAGQVDVGTRTIPQPPGADLNSVLAQITGSLFADVDAKAAFWQRARIAQPGKPAPVLTSAPVHEDIAPMLEAFHLAYANLQEIWSLVLPPQSLLGLKRLSVMTPENFVMQDSLWARIVYDFLLAYRLRTINRGHLLGALTPLYLAWVASHIQLTATGTPPESHIEAVATAFETDKPYLVSRWRWPDRFNP
jgi:hypothetical protein